MPAPLNIDREQVRMLVLSIGVRPAARQLGIPEPTVQAWAARGAWLDAIKPRPKQLEDRATANAKALQPAMQPIATSPVNALENVILTNSNRSKVAASAYAARTLEHAASLAESDPDRALAEASNAKAVTQTAALAGSWETAASGGVTAVQINIG